MNIIITKSVFVKKIGRRIFIAKIVNQARIKAKNFLTLCAKLIQFYKEIDKYEIMKK